jgi:hypothetical protein
MIRKTLNLFATLMTGMTDKEAQAALLNMQKSIDYCMEENRVLWGIILATAKESLVAA